MAAKKLFGADGIRGQVNRYPLTEEAVRQLGRALAVWLCQSSTGEPPNVLIGTDTRESGGRLKAAFTRGLLSAGLTVVDVGILPTAAISYLAARLGIFDAGVMISASHGPIIENGIKLMQRTGAKFADRDELAVEDLFFRTDAPGPVAEGGRTVEGDYGGHYLESLLAVYGDAPWPGGPVLIDCANGAAYEVFPTVLETLHIPFVSVNVWPDGTNANWDAGSEYVRLNPRRLAAELHKYDAALGIALDGDADRVLLVDPEGRLYDGDMLLSILALKFQAEGALRGDTVVATTMSNSGLEHFLRRHGLACRLVGSGDKYVSDELLRDGLLLGGEQIGHVVIHTDETHVTGDGIRTALYVLQELARRPGARLVDLAADMRKWPQVRVGAYIGPGHWEMKPGDVPGLEDLFAQTEAEVADLTKFEHRPASTEPFYRVMMEARTTDVATLARYARHIAEHVQRHLGCAGRFLETMDCSNGGIVG